MDTSADILDVLTFEERVIDGNGREWALMRNGSWGCLGHSITVDSVEELDARYIVMAVA